jgi:RecB family exonuclease
LTTSPNALLGALSDRTRESPLAEKLLICDSRVQGIEILAALSRMGTPWVAWRATTVTDLAIELATPGLAAKGIQPGDALDMLAWAEDGFEAVLARGEGGPLAEASSMPGYREAVARTVEHLRMGAIRPEDLTGRSRKLDTLAAVLGSYEQRLHREKLADSAAILDLADQAVRSGQQLEAAFVGIVPGLTRRGRPGRLLQSLVDCCGAEVLEADSVRGLVAPGSIYWRPASPPHQGPTMLPTQEAEVVSDGTSGIAVAPPGEGAPIVRLSLFAAASPADEIREILRRVVAQGTPLDRVEIVASEPDLYASLLETFAARFGAAATYATGLDARRTRVGRAADTYLTWIESGFPADSLRILLETGDLVPGGEDGPSGATLARRLRRLAIGWGRDRYIPRIDQALALLAHDDGQRADESDEDFEDRQGRERNELQALRDLLQTILAATPKSSGSSPLVSAAAIAAGLQIFLEHVPARTSTDGAVRSAIRERMERVQGALTRPTTYAAATAIVRSRAGIRINSSGDGSGSWNSAGGKLFLSDFKTGGYSGRDHIYVVGLDSSIMEASDRDPLLSDTDRAAISAGREVRPLATQRERSEERRHEAASLLARLRGCVTLSYACKDAVGRDLSPAPLLLQAYRSMAGNPTAGYEDLRAALRPVACAVPDAGQVLDSRDAWLAALAPGGTPLAGGRSMVEQAFPGLGAGIEGRRQRQGGDISEYSGALRLSRFPFDKISASGLETLGTCPRRFMYRQVLGVYPPDDPDLDDSRWLDPLTRGKLLHEVFEQAVRSADDQGIPYHSPAFEQISQRELEKAIKEIGDPVPAPNQAVRSQEIDDLKIDVRSFVALIRDAPPNVQHLEYEFGWDGSFTIPTAYGPLVLRGRIDRVDVLPDGSLRVVDYKTGGVRDFSPDKPFAGGRRIQHSVYLHAVRSIGQPGEMEYQFATRRGKNATISYPWSAIGSNTDVFDDLAAIAAKGPFVPTDSVGDCKFCDYTSLCRAESNEYGNLACAIVTDTKSKMKSDHPDYAPLARIRSHK